MRLYALFPARRGNFDTSVWLICDVQKQQEFMPDEPVLPSAVFSNSSQRRDFKRDALHRDEMTDGLVFHHPEEEYQPSHVQSSHAGLAQVCRVSRKRRRICDTRTGFTSCSRGLSTSSLNASESNSSSCIPRGVQTIFSFVCMNTTLGSANNLHVSDQVSIDGRCYDFFGENAPT